MRLSTDSLLLNYIIAHALIGIIPLGVGLFVIIKGFNKILYRRFFIYNALISCWGIFTVFMQFAPSSQLALLFDRIELLAIVFIAPTSLHFTLEYLQKTKEFKKLISFVYILSTLFFILTFTPLMAKSVSRKGFVTYFTDPGAAYLVFVILFSILMTGVIIAIYKSYITEKSDLRKQGLLYFLIATLVANIGGGANFLVPYGIIVPILMPYGTYAVVLYGIITAYVITHHHLLEIEVVIKKTVVFAGMFIFAFSVFVSVALLISQFIAGARIISLAISSLIIVIGLRPLETWLINVTDRFLFQKKYEYKQVLKAFITEVVTILNLDQVVSSTLKLLDQTLHPYTTGIFILNKVEDKYQLYNSLGFDDKNLSFTSESKLINFFKKSHQPAVIRQINGIVSVNPDIQQEMDSLKAVICLPFLLHNDLIGFISLGKKKSDEEYTKDDLDVLLDLSRTESIAVGNAQLLTEAAQAERRAAIGTMSAGINHEIGNPVNIMSTKIQVFKLARQKGLFKDMPTEEVLDQAEATLDECLKQSQRISEITKKLSNFAKPSKEFKPQLINIAEEVEETLSMVGHDLELEKIKIEKNISSDLYKILADKREIQQIFFNIIRNAAQAIEETGKITISAVNTTNNKVHIEVQDTGKGIPEDKIQRIFEPFFTTKGPNKGTGLGLSIVRQLVWKNKGEISFRSQAGVGTTFILEFPKGGAQ